MISYATLLENFTALLKEQKLKFTRQREMILKVLYEHNGHFSPEEIHRMILESNPDLKVGIATVYRTLTLLEDAGLADSISFGKDGKIYELGLKKHHDHLICTGCGTIIEFVDELIEAKQEEIAKKYHFHMTDHTMKIIGLCQECQKNL
jgi:Fur family ferric uptake transcriptional regulator